MKLIQRRALAVLAVILLLCGCSEDNGPAGPNTTADEEQIRTLLGAWVAAVKAENVPAAMALVSAQYLQDGDTRATVESELTANLAQDVVVDVELTDVVIAVVGDKATVSAHLKVTLQSSLYEGYFDSGTPFMFTYWLKESTGWKMYGNQQWYAARAFSGHWQNGYYAELYVQDPTRRATSVTAIGPGIAGTLSFNYVSGDGFSSPRWWAESNPFLGASVPSADQIFTIKVVDSIGTHTYTRRLTGYVVAFATNLSPWGSASGSVTFSWTGIAGTDGYSVELSDDSHVRVWNAYDLPSTATSVVYDGSGLTVGHTYFYSVVSHVETDGVRNSSFADGQFIYTGGLP